MAVEHQGNAAPSGDETTPEQGAAERASEGSPASEADTPSGALAVVAFLTITIAVFWFGMYALNMVRN